MVFASEWLIVAGGLLAAGLGLAGWTRWRARQRRGYVIGWLLCWCSLSACVLPAYLTVTRPPVVESREALLARAEGLFSSHCAICHGPNGLGDGPAAFGLNPPPANLTAAHLDDHPDLQLYTWIADGFPGSAMPAFRSQLADDEIQALVIYVRQLRADSVR